MIDNLEDLVSRIVSREEDRRRNAVELRGANSKFFKRVSPADVSGRFGAVDGGLLSEEYQGFELVVARAVAVRYTYHSGNLKGVDYFPSPVPDPQIFTYDMPVDEENVGPLRSLTRLLVEIGTALGFVREMDLDFLFLDGSILPQLVDKPRGGGRGLNELYESVLNRYRDLYSECSRRNVVLAGIVKDSKGNRLSSYMGGPNLRDSVWLKHAMDVGEMTIPIPYADRPSDQATLKDLGEEIAENVWVFYLKASDYDQPFRVEFYAGGPELGEKIASLLLPLSSVNRTYTIPPFLIEADIRARLAKRSMAYVREYLEKRLGVEYNLFRMRGSNKPF